MDKELGELEVARGDFMAVQSKLLRPLEQAGRVIDAALVASATVRSAEGKVQAAQAELARLGVETDKAKAALVKLDEQVDKAEQDTVARLAAKEYEVRGKLDELNEQLKAGRASYEQQMSGLRAELAELKARADSAAREHEAAYAARLATSALEEREAQERLRTVRAELSALEQRLAGLFTR